MKLTKLHWRALAAITAYLICEFYFGSCWEACRPEIDPIIRGVLAFIYPALLMLIISSVVPFIRDKS
jgi:hypothetical protein